VKGIVAATAFVMATIAFLTMMQIRKRIPPILPGNLAAWRRWHVLSGRISLVFSIFLAFIGSGLALYLRAPTDLRTWLHVLSGILVMIWFFGKVFVLRHKIQPGIQHLLMLGATLFLLHVALFLTATIWVYWFKITGAL
jgi:hypothetical protein